MWPDGAVDVLLQTLKDFFPDNVVQDVPLDPTASSGSIAVYASNWVPDDGSHFIGSPEPADGEYGIVIQNVTIGGDLSEVRRAHSLDSKSIRTILYRAESIRVALAAMDEVFLGSRERFRSLDVVRQNFFAGRAGAFGTFHRLTETTVRVRTSITPTGEVTP